MSTTFGIKTNSGPDSIVLASDTQFSIDDGNSTQKTIGSKIRVEGEYVIAVTGDMVKLVDRFFSYLGGRTSPKNFIRDALRNKRHPIFENMPANPVLAAIEAGYFPELALVNSDYYMREYDKKSFEEISDGLIELIIATRNPSLGLYLVDSFGRVSSSSNSIDYLVSGSGTEIVQTYMDEGGYQSDPIINIEVREDKIALPVAISLAIGAIKKASRDRDTGGPIDLVVVTQEAIETHGQEIRRYLAEAEREIYQRIVGKYSQDS